MRKTGWPTAIAIAGATVLTELVAVYGHNQGTDTLAFVYIALHYGILPLSCLVHGVLNAHAVWADPRPMWDRIIDASSGIISLTYLSLLYFRPLPLFGMGG